MEYSTIQAFVIFLDTAIFAVTVLTLTRVVRLEAAMRDVKTSIKKMEAREKAGAEDQDQYGLSTRLGEIRHMRFSPFMGKYSASHPGKNEK